MAGALALLRNKANITLIPKADQDDKIDQDLIKLVTKYLKN